MINQSIEDSNSSQGTYKDFEQSIIDDRSANTDQR